MKKTIIITILSFIGLNLNAQWVTQISGTTTNLYDVYFVNNNKGVVVGGNGLIRNTNDGGATWTTQVSGVTGYLHGITFINDTTGYIVGELGTILKTVDSGVNWTILTSGTTTNLLDVYFVDINNGYAVGWNGLVLKTTDAGTNWTLSNSGINTLINLTGIQFTSVNNGYVTGLSGFLYKTIDGGNSWNQTSSTIGSLNLFETHFISSNVGFVVGENSSFLKTVDGGINWTSVFGGGIVLRGIYFTNSNNGYAVGDYTGIGIIRETIDGGINWTTTMSGGSIQNNVYFPSPNTGYAVGNNGNIRKLSLTVTSTDIKVECDSLVWIDGNTYYTDNNSATFNILNGASNGYDSLVTLNLTINNSTTGTDVQTACDSYVWIDGNTYTASNNTVTYNIVGGAANGCDSTVILNLTISSSPDIGVITTDNTLTANASNASYQWVDCDSNNLPITGETSQSFAVTQNGSYAVIITEGICSDTSTCVQFTSVGIEELIDLDIEVYPNPTIDFISIKNTQTPYSISIYNTQGILVWSKNSVTLNKYKIDLSNMSNGFYLIVLKNKNSIINKKIVIKN